MASVFAAVGSPTTKGTLKLDELEKGIAKTRPEAEQFAKAEGSTALSGLATALDSGLPGNWSRSGAWTSQLVDASYWLC